MKKEVGVFVCFLFILISSTSACKPCLQQTKATFDTKSNRSVDQLAFGFCGYEGFYKGHIAAGAPSLINNGFGCGSCFHVRCKDPVLCSSKGTTVVLTDILQNQPTTDLLLSKRAFRALANNGKFQDLMKLRKVDVEYSRIPCQYKNHNLSVLIDGFTKFSAYLTIEMVYQGGVTEIIGVDVQEAHSSKWLKMTKLRGAVWSLKIKDGSPYGTLSFRFTVTVYGKKFTFESKNVLPPDHHAELGLYDTGIDLNRIKLDSCPPCKS